jgi:DNA sulfur modification protein DndB
MKDLATSVNFAQQGKALEETLQRQLNESRAKTEIVSYLQRQPDRFFNSVVIAAEGGDPKWFPVKMTDDPALALLQGSPLLENAFGVLRFDGTEKYFALDGQHRLKAIRELTEPDSPSYLNRPVGFENEEISVVLVVPGEVEDLKEFRRRFRRLFGHLNRYAKPMDLATTIIMDEDDSFAIVTRQLFEDHEFFQAVGPHKNSIVVDTTKGANMNPNQVHFTKIEVLYAVNEILLDSNERKNLGFDDAQTKAAEFKRYRPNDDEVLDKLYAELAMYWTSILNTLPELRSEAVKMRNHSVIGAADKGDDRDHMLFWPIGQKMLAKLVRALFDQEGISGASTLQHCEKALEPLKKVKWDMEFAPWRNMMIVPKDDKWNMRNEQRDKVILVLVALLSQFLNPKFSPDADSMLDLKKRCGEYLDFGPDEKDVPKAIDNWWSETLKNIGLNL